MKIVIIHGQNHKGSTYLIARELAEKIGGEIEEFFLPRDFDKPCAGCWTCFRTDLTQCPHYEKLRPIVEAIDAADVLILASPVYVYHATGQMMAFLDHFGTRWLVHRPEPAYFRKQAVVISTAAGGGMKSTSRIWPTASSSGASRASTGWAWPCAPPSLRKLRQRPWNISIKKLIGLRKKSEIQSVPLPPP